VKKGKFHMEQNSRFDHYRQLLKRVEEKFSEIHTRYPKQFQCGKGCFGCCKSGLTVTNVEGQHIRDWLMSHPEKVAEIIEADENPHHGEKYCKFLSASGACLIYEVRPIVCRSHGAPLLVPNENEEGEFDGDVCPLNFTDFDLAELDAKDWIRLDTLNTILVRIDLEFDKTNAGVRRPLGFSLVKILPD
jgi:Fe-S-cluster containining protein